VGVFIQISLDTTRLDPALSQELVTLCPVDIFDLKEGELIVKLEQEDECTLCGLCLHAAPSGAIRIFKTYGGETLMSQGDRTKPIP
jgi:NAD-dependent dihydropyrimidine dehydrogenase PreA subunit